MHTCEINLGRRHFLRFTAIAAAGAIADTMARTSGAAPVAVPGRKTILSFYCDDTGPYTAGTGAFRTFLDYCAEQQIAGESSLILGASRRSMVRNPNREESAYLDQVRRAWQCGLDTHMELMTHRGLFDFAAGRQPEGAIHEGWWLHDRAITAEQYEHGLDAILAEAQHAGIRMTGLTWPGCSCDACTRSYTRLRKSGQQGPNPALWKAVLSLARQGRFRGPTVPCFFDPTEAADGLRREASAGQHAVFDLMPNALDHFGSWSNSRDRVDPDYYITTDGKSGVIVRRVQAGAPYCLWYAHWQGLNPARGVGWQAFRTTVERIRTHLKGRVVWMRPSDITNRYQQSEGWSFLDHL
jgi:hypothetical protein